MYYICINFVTKVPAT